MKNDEGEFGFDLFVWVNWKLMDSISWVLGEVDNGHLLIWEHVISKKTAQDSC